MVLLHGGSPKGAELIAAKWAAQRNVPQIAFKPDWTKHRKAAPSRPTSPGRRRDWRAKKVTRMSSSDMHGSQFLQRTLTGDTYSVGRGFLI
jgi:hypothetical protein